MDMQRIIDDALARTIDLGGRGLHFGPAGLSVIDAFGTAHPITVAGEAVEIEESEALAFNVKGNRGTFYPETDTHRDYRDLGEWSVARDKVGSLVLRPNKPKLPCLEPVSAMDGEDLARMRSLYREGGFDVVVISEGAPRAEAFARAMMAERGVLGLNTAIDVPKSSRSTWYWGEEKEDRSPVIDPISSGASPWTIKVLGEGRGPYEHLRELSDQLKGDADPRETRVFVVGSRQPRSVAGLTKDLERPVLEIIIKLVDSKPIARFEFSEALLARTSVEPGFEGAPWDAYNARLAAHRSSRSASAPKTWHQTTLAVARAFVERDAPRGYVSGKSLFFHGPVAFSIWDDNPIAAFVEFPGRDPIIFMGRADGIGGGKSAIVSMAQGDISAAARDRFDVVMLDDLSEVLKLGDRKLDDVAFRFRHDKNEGAYPTSCTFDPARLAEWFAMEKSRRLSEVASAEVTRMPTYRKASAYAAVAELGKLRTRFAAISGIELPEIADVGRFMALSRAERTAADGRAERLREEAAEKRAAQRSAWEAAESEEDEINVAPGMR